MTVKFAGWEFPDDMTVEQLALKLGEAEGFKVVGNAYRSNIELETYDTGEGGVTAQEIINRC